MLRTYLLPHHLTSLAFQKELEGHTIRSQAVKPHAISRTEKKLTQRNQSQSLCARVQRKPKLIERIEVEHTWEDRGLQKEENETNLENRVGKPYFVGYYRKDLNSKFKMNWKIDVTDTLHPLSSLLYIQNP
ncbi:hypothetical protein QVD17_24962 [Tagetes erecta]|uniref:Uncharacterized protein n=1 Tax=Tagetes erecta TaxID=13708 RepID=A0AAD8NMZ8_TARER|nr:hypothetical protein QVD17_24962 [Tagetes erecta]